ncbi:MAG: hypothetical protein AB1679_24000 [Actinomycetota bacterium]|jgi:hypothetical protein
MEAFSCRVGVEEALEEGARLGAVVVEGDSERLAIDPRRPLPAGIGSESGDAGRLRPGGRLPSVPMREVALATARFSDSAAADYLLHRLGENRLREAVETLAVSGCDYAP